MRSRLWLILGVSLLIAFAALAWWPADTRILPDHGIYPAASKIADEQALGGFGKCDNFPKNLAGQNWGEAGAVSLVAFPEEATPGKTDRFIIRLVNRTDAVIGFTACDSCLYLAQEAVDSGGNWRPIELPPPVICGNSFHRVFLDKNQYWEFAAHRYSGLFKTRIRFRLEQGESRPFAVGEGDDLPRRIPSRGGRVIHSNEFEGSINPSQFVTEREDE